MIDFMAESASQQILAAHLEKLALHVLRSDGYEMGSHHVPTKARNGKAALLFTLLAFGVNDFWIRQHDFCLGILAARDVDYRQPHAQSNLWCRQADTLRGVHGGKHVFTEL